MITFAIERHGYVHVYGENKEEILFSQQGKLYNYTCENVAVLRMDQIYIYNKQGDLVFNMKK